MGINYPCHLNLPEPDFHNCREREQPNFGRGCGIHPSGLELGSPKCQSKDHQTLYNGMRYIAAVCSRALHRLVWM